MRGIPGWIIVISIATSGCLGADGKQPRAIPLPEYIHAPTILAPSPIVGEGVVIAGGVEGEGFADRSAGAAWDALSFEIFQFAPGPVAGAPTGFRALTSPGDGQPAHALLVGLDDGLFMVWPERGSEGASRLRISPLDGRSEGHSNPRAGWSSGLMTRISWPISARPRFREGPAAQGAIPVVTTRPGRPRPSVQLVLRTGEAWRIVSPRPDILTTLVDATFRDDSRLAMLGVGAGPRPLGVVDRPEVFLATIDIESGTVDEMWVVERPGPGKAVAGLGLLEFGPDSLLAWWRVTEPGGTVITPELHATVVGLGSLTAEGATIQRVDSSFHIGNVRVIKDSSGPLLLYIRSPGPLPIGPLVARRWWGEGWSPPRELALGTAAYFDAHLAPSGDLHLVVSRPERRSRLVRRVPRETVWTMFERSVVNDWFK